MGLVSLLQRQVESRAQSICKMRNQNTPAELGKAGYEVTDDGVVFIKQHFLLDSSHCDYMDYIAKVSWNNQDNRWQLSIPHQTLYEEWVPYPFLPYSTDLTAIIREVDKDPKEMFWND
ncbi:DUF3024 domain-containing protein [Vibrio brasiliensis]|uniref:DUF3024 domain-containing protein n=1 Tax=Vibrio brasiliensis TaxID=170652 RepID=UPI001EFC7964|nr:DUF3024 domain-containing protein [Vibrio brasiliensis]MCG9649154.1 DUF3024 domain-containing protein [Vibrio brasiliensis]MCG9725332.1 DUF3024 domain-containing protein [Vibrio brasiliensis]